MFETLQAVPADAILGLGALFRADTNPGKVDLTVGVYRDGSGITPVMQAIAAAEREVIAQQKTKVYLPPRGIDGYLDETTRLVLGAEHSALERTASIQTPGGSGALRLAADLLLRAQPQQSLLISDPSWPNHRPLLSVAGMKVDSYPYFNTAQQSLQTAAMIDRLEQASAGTVVLLQASCHNPSGADPGEGEWRDIIECIERRRLLPFFDLAYQGLGESLTADAAPVRLAAQRLPEVLIAVSASKNFGLYRERTGALLIVTNERERRPVLESNLAQIARRIYSMPPAHGGLLAERVMTNAALRQSWQAELDAMAKRLRSLRAGLADALSAIDSDRDYGWLRKQRGMFSLLGLSPEQVARMRDQHHVYVVGDSRINIAGLTENTTEKVAQAIVAVSRS
ncbi:MAG: amino acid aminotransferase [Steroidobacteraceae bacterium]